jgi:hypothetical protein
MSTMQQKSGRNPMGKDMVKITDYRLKFSSRAIRQIKSLRKRLNAISLADVIRSSLRLMAFLEQEHRHGSQIIIIKKNGTMREIDFNQVKK